MESTYLPSTELSPKEEGMSLEEYQAKFGKPQTAKAVRFGLLLAIGSIGVVLFAALFVVVKECFALHEIAGYVSLGLSLLAFVLLYIVPLVNIAKLPAFKTEVNSRTAKEAKAHNRKVRRQIADMMIDMVDKAPGLSFYDERRVGTLAIAKSSGDEQKLLSALKEIYELDVAPVSQKLIAKTAVKVGTYTALSQSPALDTAIVGTYCLKLVKDIVFLYGFRPSEYRLSKIYAAVVRNALIAYGAAASLGGIGQTAGTAMSSLPLLGGVIGSVIGSVSQGIVNGAMMVVIGYETKRYLNKEYRMQEMLEHVELGDETESETIAEVRGEIGKAIKSKGKKATD